MTSKLDFLAQLPIFEALEEDELRALNQICDEYEFADGAVIAYQRDVADSMYIVRSGRLFARLVDGRGIVRDTQPYEAGDYFGDIWMFAQDVHPATIKATGVGRVIIIRSQDFMDFLGRFPQALERLEPTIDEDDIEYGLSEEAWEEARKSRLKADKTSASISLLPDELVEFWARRSRWYLALRTAVPALGLLIFPLWVLTILTGQPPETLLHSIRWGVTLILTVVFGVWLLFQILDWANDYFVITNKHLAHHEFSLRTFRTVVNKIPIDQIQSVEVERPTLLASLFNFGTARISTASSMGMLRFDSIDDPGRVEETLNWLRHRVQAMDEGRAQESMRRSVEGHFQLEPTIQPLEADTDEEVEMEEYVAPQPGGLTSFIRAFINRYRWRVEENGVVTYRKHFFILAREVIWPAGIGLALAIIAVILARATEFPNSSITPFFLVISLLDFGWLIWEIEDWRNDTFQLTDFYVFDIDRRPFGFGESRKQAELSNVQNVNSDRPNILATLFNFGNVVIETAGATADITFENVSNPNRIQSDIFHRRDALRRKQAIRDGEERRKEYSVLLDVYHQAVEQGRIPRRTPEALPREPEGEDES